MPKKKIKESVYHDWVLRLPFQMQALIATAMRGPDGVEKVNSAKNIIRFMRGSVMKPAGIMPPDRVDSFMRMDWGTLPSAIKVFWSDHDEYPHHFIMHLVHCAQVIGYKHKSAAQRFIWNKFYLDACDSFHMRPETEKQMDKRLNDFGCGVHNKIANQ